MCPYLTFNSYLMAELILTISLSCLLPHLYTWNFNMHKWIVLCISWCLIFIHYCIWLADILFRILESTFLSEKYYTFVLHFPCLVLQLRLHQSYKWDEQLFTLLFSSIALYNMLLFLYCVLKLYVKYLVERCLWMLFMSLMLSDLFKFSLQLWVPVTPDGLPTHQCTPDLLFFFFYFILFLNFKILY